MAEELKDKLKFFKVDIDENEETSNSEKIGVIPTFKVYKKGITEYEQISGEIVFLKDAID